MKLLSPILILITLILLLLTQTFLATALLGEEASKISFQVNHSDRIIIGTVDGIDVHSGYTIYTIRVKEWIYKPFPAKVIKVRTEIGTNFWTEDEAEFTLNESALLLLKNENLDEKLFRVALGFPGKHPVSDRDEVIKELRAQGKLPEGNQTENETNEIEVVENQTENKTYNAEEIESTEIGNKHEENPADTQKKSSTPFISLFWMLATLSMAIMYVRRRK